MGVREILWDAEDVKLSKTKFSGASLGQEASGRQCSKSGCGSWK